MGFKRPFDEEGFQEFLPKHPRQVDCGNKLTSFMEIYPCHEPTQKADIPGEGEGMFCRFESGDGLEYENRNVVSDLDDKEFESSAPLSWVTSSTIEEDGGSGAPVCSLSLEHSESYLPRRSRDQFEDKYSSLLYGSPRKQIPVGPNHQAEVPVWDPQAMGKYSLGSDHITGAFGGKLIGDCIFPMPDPELSAHSSVKTWEGRRDCLCPDQGSIRCVRQHVKEARERISETIGHEKFVQLGFCDMGEEVSQKWTEEEERVFHEIVYSYPMFGRKNFWEHLSAVFLSQTKEEIVSYYFNVFMLRRRAVQNRSNFLDIDSDDDEWQGTQEVEDSAIVSLVDQDVQVGYEDDSPDDDDDDDDDGDDEYGDGVTINGEGNASENDDVVDLFGSANTTAAVRESGVKSDHKECLHGYDDGSTDGLSPGYLVEPHDAKIWDANYPMSPFEGVDLLSTGNTIEDILGPWTQEQKVE